MLRVLYALGDFIKERFPKMPVEVAYAYDWDLERDEKMSGERVVVEAYGGGAGNIEAPGSQINIARGAWRETMNFRVTYVKKINSQKTDEIDLAAATAEQIFPIFRKVRLPGIDEVRWQGTNREVFDKRLVKGAGLLLVPFVVSYRYDHVESR